jgi:hypothetical protein
MPGARDRNFAAKALAFNKGWKLLEDMDYEIIGNLDADITFDPDYCEFLLGKFAANPSLGVAGTPFTENKENPHDHRYAHRFASLTHVSGACQMFRRKCFVEIGGYVPVKSGAIDWIAVTTARMKGWQTQTFPEKVCFHHRKLGTGSDRVLGVRFHYGQKAYFMGGHLLWELPRGLFQMREKPYVLAGLWFLAGYLNATVRRLERPVSAELMAFHRKEQLVRLAGILRLGKHKRP